MAGAISSIGSSISAVQGVSSSSTKLSEETKKKLEALGIDTSSIKTEAQGQAKLTEAKAAQASKNTQHPQQAGAQNGQMEAMKAQAVSLAQKMGLSVSADASLSDIMSALSNELKNMKVQAVGSPEKVGQYKEYQAQYAAIASSVDAMEAQKQSSSKITGSMAGMANYNKAFFNL